MTFNHVFIVLFLLYVSQLTRAAFPTITGLSHSLCAASGDSNDADLYGCPVQGGGILTVTGTDFDVTVVNITSVCLNAPTYVSSTSMTCMLMPGMARSVTAAPKAILANGSFIETSSPGIHYAYMPVVTDIVWNGEGCLHNGGSFPRIYTRCPFDGTVQLTISGTNFQNIGPLAGITFYSVDQQFNLCNGNMNLGLTQTVGGGIQTTLICQFVADPGVASNMSNAVLLTNGGNFSIASSMTFNGPPVIELLEVPTSIQVTATSVIDAPTYWTFPSPGSSQVGVKASNLVQSSNPHNIRMNGCQFDPAFNGVDMLNCTFVQGASAFIDVVIYNSVGFGSSRPNAGVNVTKAAAPTVTAILSDWCYQDISAPKILNNCPIFDTTFQITIIGTNFDRYVASSVCIANTMVRVNSTFVYCNVTTTSQNNAGGNVAVYLSTNAVTQWWDTGAVFRWAPRPTFSALSMPSCIAGATPKLLTGCPIFGSYISLNNTQTLAFIGTNFFKGPASIQIGSAAQAGAVPCIVGTERVISSTRMECSLNLQYPLDQMTQTSILLAGGWTDISTGGGGSITFAPAPTVTSVAIPLCTYNLLMNNYTNCPFDGHSPNITVIGTNYNAGPAFTTIMLTSTFDVVCNPVLASYITAVTGLNAYTTMTCQLIRDSAPSGGSILPAGKIYTNGGNATIWSSLTYAMWPTITSIVSDRCQSLSPLSVIDCPVIGNAMSPAVLNVSTEHLQPDSVVAMAGYGCESFDRSQGVNNIVCRLNYSSSLIGGIAATTIPITINNPIGYGYTQTLANLTFAEIPIISSLSLSDCDQSNALSLINCPVNQTMAQLTITGSHFTDSFNVSSNVCVPGSLYVNDSNSVFCTVQKNSSNVLSSLFVSSYGTAGYINSGATVRYAPLPIISSVSNSLCVVSATPRTLSNCPLSGSMLILTGVNIAVGPNARPNITLSPNPANIDPCVYNSTIFDPLGTWISCQIIDLSQSVEVQSRGLLDNISITTIGGTSLLSAALSYQPLPVISALSSSVCANNGSNVLFGCPVNVNGMVMLTIYGANFLQGTTIIDTTICTTGSALNVLSNTMITCPLSNFTGLGQIKTIVLSNPALYGGGNSTFLATVQATTLLPPTVSAFYDGECGQAVDGVSLIGCPSVGAVSMLTVIGTNFDLYLPTVVSSVCNSSLIVVNHTYGTCVLASQAGSSIWTAMIETNAGSTNNPLVSLQYAVSPILDHVEIDECAGSGTDMLYECPATGGQTVLFFGSNFFGSKFEVFNDQQIRICRASSITVYNFTTASCLLADDQSYIGRTITHMGVRTFGGESSHTVVLGFVYRPVVTSVTMNGCLASGTSPNSFSMCPFDPLYNLSITVHGSNFTQGFAPRLNLIGLGGVQLCDAATLSFNRTTVSCMINRSLMLLPGSALPMTEVVTQTGIATVFSGLSFSNRVTITHISSSMCVIDGHNLIGCPVYGNSDSPFNVTVSVSNLMTTDPIFANNVCANIDQSLTGTIICTVNDSLATQGAVLPLILIDQFGYMDTTSGTARSVNMANFPSVSTFSGMDSACKQRGVAMLEDCPTNGGNAVVFNGVNFDSWFQSSICDPSSITVVSSTQVTCNLLSKPPTYGEMIQISTHGTAGWINSTAHVSYASVPSITNISSPLCEQINDFDIFDCPLQGGAMLNVSGHFLNGGAVNLVTMIGGHAICVSNTIVVSSDGTWLSCTISDFTGHLPMLKWNFTLSTNGGMAAQNMSLEWFPLPRMDTITSSVCRSYSPTTLVDCPLDAGAAVTVNGEFFKPDVTISHPSDCQTVNYVNSTQFVCLLAYRPRSSVNLIIVSNPRGYGESNEIASITSSPLAFPMITGFNNSACTRSPSNAGSLFDCSSVPGQILTIIGENFDVNTPVYVHDVCGAQGPVAVHVVSTVLAYCPSTISDASFAGGVFPAHIETNGGEAIFPRVTITWFTLVAPAEMPITRSTRTGIVLPNLPINSLQVSESGNFTLTAPPRIGYPTPIVSWEVSYDNVTWTTIASNTSSVTISGVNITMVGALYRPAYTNQVGKVAGEIVPVYVEIAPRPVNELPVNFSTTYGHTAALNASFMGHPVPQVQWQYMSAAGVWVNVTATQSSASNSTGAQSSLIVGDQSEYVRQYRTCYSNAFGSNCTASVAVYAEQYPRNITVQSTNITYQIGQPLPVLSSAVYGYPTPTVQWYRLNVTRNGTYVIGNITGTWAPMINGTHVFNNSSDLATVQTSLDLPFETESGSAFYQVCFTNTVGTNCSDVMVVNAVTEPVADVESSSASSMSKGAIVGLVIGVVFAALLLCLCCYFILAAVIARKRRGQDGGVAQDDGVVPSAKAATKTDASSSFWFAGALCGVSTDPHRQDVQNDGAANVANKSGASASSWLAGTSFGFAQEQRHTDQDATQRDVAVASASGSSIPSWFAGALCGLAEPEAKKRYEAYDVEFGA